MKNHEIGPVPSIYKPKKTDTIRPVFSKYKPENSQDGPSTHSSTRMKTKWSRLCHLVGAGGDQANTGVPAGACLLS